MKAHTHIYHRMYMHLRIRATNGSLRASATASSPVSLTRAALQSELAPSSVPLSARALRFSRPLRFHQQAASTSPLASFCRTRQVHSQAAAAAAASTPRSTSQARHSTRVIGGAGLVALLLAVALFLSSEVNAESIAALDFSQDTREPRHFVDSAASVASVVVTEDVPSNTSSTLPLYHLAEVRQHGPDSERPWVIYKDKVFDITDWIPAHPGDEVILRAAGGHIEPYWDIFSIHKTQYVRDIMEQYVVGQVHPDDLQNGNIHEIEDPFTLDPERDARLHLLTQKPCNAESPASGLADSFLTPNELFYVRNHMWVPKVDHADKYEFSIELSSGDIKSYTVADLKSRFKQHKVTAVLQCSGNRRKDMTEHARKTNGLQWTVGAISCTEWEGVRLRDVLADAGLSFEPDEVAQHVQLVGLEAYGASIPIASALDPRGDVLLAMRMNGRDLPEDHGFPIRAVVPGHVAARSVKWLKKIVVSDEESNTTWQRSDYKCFGPNETKQDWDKYKSIQKMPVTSAITRTQLKKALLEADAEKSDTGALHDDILQVEGYAYSGGGHEIQRVDISLDGGKTWDQASLVQGDRALERGSQAWCWKRWRYEARLAWSNGGREGDPASQEQKASIVVKATDDVYNTQPENYDSIYNLRGNLATAWHRVEVTPGATRVGNAADKLESGTCAVSQ